MSKPVGYYDGCPVYCFQTEEEIKQLGESGLPLMPYFKRQYRWNWLPKWLRPSRLYVEYRVFDFTDEESKRILRAAVNKTKLSTKWIAAVGDDGITDVFLTGPSEGEISSDEYRELSRDFADKAQRVRRDYEDQWRESFQQSEDEAREAYRAAHDE